MFFSDDVVRPGRPVDASPVVTLSAQLFLRKYAGWLSRLAAYHQVQVAQTDLLVGVQRIDHEQRAHEKTATFFATLKILHRAARRQLKQRFRRRWLVRTLAPCWWRAIFIQRCRAEQWIHPAQRLADLRQRLREKGFDHCRPTSSESEIRHELQAYFQGAYGLAVPEEMLYPVMPTGLHYYEHIAVGDEYGQLLQLLEVAQKREADYQFHLPVKLMAAADRLPARLATIRQEVTAVDARLTQLAPVIARLEVKPQWDSYATQLDRIDADHPAPSMEEAAETPRTLP